MKDFVKKNPQMFLYSILFDECALNLFSLLKGANSKLRDIGVCRTIFQLIICHNLSQFKIILNHCCGIFANITHPLLHENAFLCFVFFTAYMICDITIILILLSV